VRGNHRGVKGQMLSMKDQVMEAIEAIRDLYERKGVSPASPAASSKFDSE